MSMELPSAWSGTKTLGFAEEAILMADGSVELVAMEAAARSSTGITVNEAAAVAVPRNWRRDMPVGFMGTGKYNGIGWCRGGRLVSPASARSGCDPMFQLRKQTLPRAESAWEHRPRSAS